MAGVSSSLRTTLLTCAALVAFAANSLLCRWALGQHYIDAASFSTVRVVAGAATLTIILMARGRGALPRLAPDWRMAAALCAYMLGFSFAYLSLSAGTGALILFGCVQLTMFIVSLRGGEHFSSMSWGGLAIAFAGLIYLVSPGLSAPDPLGAILMGAAGVAWGFYSLLGRGAKDPLQATAANFVFSVPVVLAVSIATFSRVQLSEAGLALAIASGAVASGCGYVIWYAALRGLTGARAAVVQLAVPVIAAIAGVAILREQITARLVIASAATLGGVAIVLAQRSAKRA
ncbi:MAG: DMT family transporter [Proteobacteria bacterium]|nr:DMT family transporter [Pseudomonadota bacterium]